MFAKNDGDVCNFGEQLKRTIANLKTKINSGKLLSSEMQCVIVIERLANDCDQQIKVVCTLDS